MLSVTRIEELALEYKADADKCKTHGDTDLYKTFKDTAEAMRELQAHRNAISEAYYWLSRDGKYTSQAKWDGLMRGLEKSYKMIWNS